MMSLAISVSIGGGAIDVA